MHLLKKTEWLNCFKKHDHVAVILALSYRTYYRVGEVCRLHVFPITSHYFTSHHVNSHYIRSHYIIECASDRNYYMRHSNADTTSNCRNITVFIILLSMSIHLTITSFLVLLLLTTSFQRISLSSDSVPFYSVYFHSIHFKSS